MRLISLISRLGVTMLAHQNTIPNRFICSSPLVGYYPSKIKLNRDAYENNQKNITNQRGKAVPAFN